MSAVGDDYPHPSALLRKYGLGAKKSWGQNFLCDSAAYAAILRAAALTPEDWAIEIGAGLGTLTARLCDAAGKFITIERDRDMAAIVRAELAAHLERGRLELVEGNALTYDYAAVAARAGRRPVLVGNLPYQIATPLLFLMIDARRTLARWVCMLQLEMAERIVAPPGSKTYGGLGVMCQAYARVKLVAKVKAGAFLPAPKVDSAVVLFEPFEAGARCDLGDDRRFADVVRRAFQMRRKTLRNALRSGAPVEQLDAALASTGIDGGRRGETLSVEEFAALSRALGPLGVAGPDAGGAAPDVDENDADADAGAGDA